MGISALKFLSQRLLTRLARSVVAHGLRPQVAALLCRSRQETFDAQAQRDAAEWILRHGLPPGVMDLLTAPENVEVRLTMPLSAAARAWAHWVARDCIAQCADGSLHMPLVDSINSDKVVAPFLAGENIQIMQGSIVTPDSHIGGNSYIGFNSHITKARIGRYVSIADGVLIGMGEHFVNQVSTSSLFYTKPYAMLTRNDCVIHDDVWVGAACIIRRGVTIGAGAVIGANSFVNCDVDPFAIMVGSPARCIGYRFSPEKIARLLESRWWELPAPQARQRIANLTSELDISQ
jgi:acetyltransferase-like isoleucine patch superfamily enzyme